MGTGIILGALNDKFIAQVPLTNGVSTATPPNVVVASGATGTGQFINGTYDLTGIDEDGYAYYDHRDFPGQVTISYRITYNWWALRIDTTEYYRNLSTSKIVPKTNWTAQAGEGNLVLSF